MSFLFISNSESSQTDWLSRDTQQKFTLLLQIDRINFNVFIEERVFIQRCLNLGSEGQGISH
jgi:hypothetical protein